MRKIYTSCNERTNTHYYKNFEEIERLPEIGVFFEGRKIIEINELYMDCEQPDDDNFLFDIFEIICEDEDVDTMEYYVCIQKELDSFDE